MDQRFAIIGTGGMLGRDLFAAAREREGKVIGFDGPQELDVTAPAAVRNMVREHQPTVVINAAGWTDVDAAERHPEQARAVNRDGPASLAAACRENDALLIHYSTDYVFPGDATEPIPPDAQTDPINEYGRTKLEGEIAIRQSKCRHLIIRTSWLFAPHGSNFFLTMRRLAAERSELKVVNDQRGRPTYCTDLACTTLSLIDCGATGTINATNSGECTWFEFATEVVRAGSFDCRVEPCTTDEFPRPALRPAYSVLDLTELARLVGEPPDWRDAVKRCTERLNQE